MVWWSLRLTENWLLCLMTAQAMQSNLAKGLAAPSPDSPVIIRLVFRCSGKRVAAGEVKRLVDPSLCLLYTSPSPRDGLLSRMPSSA